MNLEILTCPNCGAPINLQSGKCDYCDTVFHIGWSKERLLQLHEEKIKEYKEEIEKLKISIYNSYIPIIPSNCPKYPPIY